jgi:hypothetical protein
MRNILKHIASIHIMAFLLLPAISATSASAFQFSKEGMKVHEAYMKYREAIRTKDVEAVKAAHLRGKGDPDAEEMIASPFFKIIQATAATDIAANDEYFMGDYAVLVYDIVEKGFASKNMVCFIRKDGVWRHSLESWLRGEVDDERKKSEMENIMKKCRERVSQ